MCAVLFSSFCALSFFRILLSFYYYCLFTLRTLELALSVRLGYVVSLCVWNAYVLHIRATRIAAYVCLCSFFLFNFNYRYVICQNIATREDFRKPTGGIKTENTQTTESQNETLNIGTNTRVHTARNPKRMIWCGWSETKKKRRCYDLSCVK